MIKFFFTASFLLIAFLSVAQDYSMPPVLINAKELIGKGAKSYDEDKYEESLSYYKQIPENDTAYSLALYEQALSYKALKKPLEAIKLLKKGLSMRTEYRRNYQEMLGSAYNESGDFENSVKAYREALKEFPNYDLYYNGIGITFSSHKGGDSALINFTKAVELNPLRPLNHLKLSAFLIANNQLIPALMSYLVYATLETHTSRSVNQLTMYEKILKKETPLNNDSALQLSINAEQFLEVEQIVKSNMAVSNDYKVPVKISYPYLIKNFHVLMEKIQINKSGSDIWNTFYIEVLKKIYNEGKFEPFILNIFSSADVEDIQKEVSKNKKDIDGFKSWFVDLLYNKYMKDRVSLVDGKPIHASHSYYTNGNINSIGNYNELQKISTGPFYFYYNNGMIKAFGEYDKTGKKDGVWKYYSSDGIITSSETEKSGTLNGEFILYHPNGSIKEKGTYVNGLLEGEAQFYFQNGALRKINSFKNNLLEGTEREYSDNGMISHVVGIREKNRYEGEIKTYFADGNLNYIANYKKGLLDGSYKTYYQNSQTIKQEGTFLNDKRSGKLIEYYESGKLLKVEDGYENGRLSGSFISYYENGNIHDKGKYQNNLLDGDYIINDSTGRMYTQINYDKNNLRKASFYAVDNKLTDQIVGSPKKYHFKNYYPDGVLYEEGDVIENNRDGSWKQYYQNANIQQELNYKAGKLNGICKTYFLHGQLKTEVNYTDDERDGLYKEYYSSGKLKQQGWYIKGVVEQSFYNYSETGNISSDVYLFHGERQGPMKLFDITGKLNYIQYYDNGTLYKVESYDTLGNTVNVSENKNGTGKLSWYFPDGKLSIETDYLYGYENGTKKIYHDNGVLFSQSLARNGMTNGSYITYSTYGKKTRESFYRSDDLDSTYTLFDFNGVKSSVMNYKYGNLNGKREWFYYSGKLETSGNYKNNERNGAFKYFAPDGTLMIQRNYVDGVLVSYTYLNSSGQLLAPIPVDNRNQEIISYYPNGQKSFKFSVIFGSIHGEMKAWFPNGNKKEENNRFYDDYEGSQKEYYENGNLMSEEFFKSDNLNGECKYYYETGKLKRVTNYLNSIKQGKEIGYDKNGEKASEIIFYNGETTK